MTLSHSLSPFSLLRRALPWALAAAACHGAAAATAAQNAAPIPPSKPVYVCPGAPEGAPEYDKPGFCGMLERIEKSKRLRVAVLLFEGAQIIDYAGPMEIFGQAGAQVFTVGPSTELRRSVFGLQVRPDYDFEHAPPADVLLVPGGNAREIANPAHKAWLRQRVAESRIVLSVCTGAFVLGEAGLLDGLPGATTFAGSLNDLGARYPKLQRVVRDRRFVDTGKIITTAGLSAGMDGALHVVERWMGREDALAVARGVEYDWNPDRLDSYGMLAATRMPLMWHMLVPPDVAAWDRYSETGDAKRWETRAHVELPQSPEAFLDFMAQRMQSDEHWAQVAAGPLWRSFRREQDGQAWEMRTALVPEVGVGEFDFVATLQGL